MTAMLAILISEKFKVILTYTDDYHTYLLRYKRFNNGTVGFENNEFDSLFNVDCYETDVTCLKHLHVTASSRFTHFKAPGVIRCPI